MWVRDSWSAGPTVERWKFCPGPAGDLTRPTPATIDQWPADAPALEALLRSEATGSTSEDEAVFVAIGDALALGYTPPAIRAAAIEVLGGLPQVTTATRTANGVALLDVSFRDEVARPGVTATLTFDSSTSELVAESFAGEGRTTRPSTPSGASSRASRPRSPLRRCTSATSRTPTRPPPCPARAERTEQQLGGGATAETTPPSPCRQSCGS